MPEKLLLPPDQATYGFDEFNSVLSAQVEGGPSRTRADIIGGDPTVNVQWTLGRAEYESLVAFYKDTTEYGSLPFFLDLFLHDAGLAEYECHFMPDSVRLSSQRAHRFQVTAKLEVKPSGRDQEYELTIIMLFEEYGSVEEADEVFAEFDPLFENMVSGAYPYSIVDAENSAIVLAEYGSLTSASEAFAEFDTYFANAVGTPRSYDPEFDENLAFILGEYGSAGATEDALSEFPVLFEAMVDSNAQELADALAPLLEVYPCCNEANVDVTLQELETLIGNLPIPDSGLTIEESEEMALIITTYGSSTTASDTLDYLDFTVNVVLPSYAGKPSTFDQEYVDNYTILFVEYGSDAVLSETITEFENLFANFPIAEVVYDIEYEQNRAILLAEYGSVESLDNTLGELETLVRNLPDTFVAELDEIVGNLAEEYPCCSEEALDETLAELETLISNLPMAPLDFTIEESEEVALIITEYGSAQVADDALQYLEFTVNVQFPATMSP